MNFFKKIASSVGNWITQPIQQQVVNASPTQSGIIGSIGRIADTATKTILTPSKNYAQIASQFNNQNQPTWPPTVVQPGEKTPTGTALITPETTKTGTTIASTGQPYNPTLANGGQTGNFATTPYNPGGYTPAPEQGRGVAAIKRDDFGNITGYIYNQGTQGSSGNFSSNYSTPGGLQGLQGIPGGEANINGGFSGTGLKTGTFGYNQSDEEEQNTEKLNPNMKISAFPGANISPEIMAAIQRGATNLQGIKGITVAPKAIKFTPERGQEVLVDIPEKFNAQDLTKAVSSIPRNLDPRDTIQGFQQTLTAGVEQEKVRLDQENDPKIPEVIRDPIVPMNLTDQYNQIQSQLGIPKIISELKDLRNSQEAIKNTLTAARDDIMEDPDFPQALKEKRVNYIFNNSMEARTFEALTGRINALNENLGLLNDQAKTALGLAKDQYEINRDASNDKFNREKQLRELALKESEQRLKEKDPNITFSIQDVGGRTVRFGFDQAGNKVSQVDLGSSTSGGTTPTGSEEIDSYARSLNAGQINISSVPSKVRAQVLTKAKEYARNDLIEDIAQAKTQGINREQLIAQLKNAYPEFSTEEISQAVYSGIPDVQQQESGGWINSVSNFLFN